MQIIAGHVDSRIHSLWQELNFLEKCVSVLQKKSDSIGTTKLCIDTDCGYLCDCICDILNSGDYSEKPKLVEEKKGLNLENLRGVNLMDDIWKILKSKKNGYFMLI